MLAYIINQFVIESFRDEINGLSKYIKKLMAYADLGKFFKYSEHANRKRYSVFFSSSDDALDF